MAYPEGFEPPLAVLETVVLPLTLKIHKLVAGLGFEPRMAKAYETSLVTGPFPQ